MDWEEKAVATLRSFRPCLTVIAGSPSKVHFLAALETFRSQVSMASRESLGLCFDLLLTAPLSRLKRIAKEIDHDSKQRSSALESEHCQPGKPSGAASAVSTSEVGLLCLSLCDLITHASTLTSSRLPLLYVDVTAPVVRLLEAMPELREKEDDLLQAVELLIMALRSFWELIPPFDITLPSPKSSPSGSSTSDCRSPLLESSFLLGMSMFVCLPLLQSPTRPVILVVVRFLRECSAVVVARDTLRSYYPAVCQALTLLLHKADYKLGSRVLQGACAALQAWVLVALADPVDDTTTTTLDLNSLQTGQGKNSPSTRLQRFVAGKDKKWFDDAVRETAECILMIVSSSSVVVNSESGDVQTALALLCGSVMSKCSRLAMHVDLCAAVVDFLIGCAASDQSDKAAGEARRFLVEGRLLGDNVRTTATQLSFREDAGETNKNNHANTLGCLQRNGRNNGEEEDSNSDDVKLQVLQKIRSKLSENICKLRQGEYSNVLEMLKRIKGYIRYFGRSICSPFVVSECITVLSDVDPDLLTAMLDDSTALVTLPSEQEDIDWLFDNVTDLSTHVSRTTSALGASSSSSSTSESSLTAAPARSRSGKALSHRRSVVNDSTPSRVSIDILIAGSRILQYAPNVAELVSATLMEFPISGDPTALHESVLYLLALPEHGWCLPSSLSATEQSVDGTPEWARRALASRGLASQTLSDNSLRSRSKILLAVRALLDAEGRAKDKHALQDTTDPSAVVPASAAEESFPLETDLECKGDVLTAEQLEGVLELVLSPDVWVSVSSMSTGRRLARFYFASLLCLIETAIRALRRQTSRERTEMQVKYLLPVLLQNLGNPSFLVSSLAMDVLTTLQKGVSTNADRIADTPQQTIRWFLEVYSDYLIEAIIFQIQFDAPLYVVKDHNGSAGALLTVVLLNAPFSMIPSLYDIARELVLGTPKLGGDTLPVWVARAMAAFAYLLSSKVKHDRRNRTLGADKALHDCGRRHNISGSFWSFVWSTEERSNDCVLDEDKDDESDSQSDLESSHLLHQLSGQLPTTSTTSSEAPPSTQLTPTSPNQLACPLPTRKRDSKGGEYGTLREMANGIIMRMRFHLSDKSLTKRCYAYASVLHGLAVLSTKRYDLLPNVHHIWPCLCESINVEAPLPALVLGCGVVCYLTILCGDFVKARFVSDLFPTFWHIFEYFPSMPSTDTTAARRTYQYKFELAYLRSLECVSRTNLVTTVATQLTIIALYFVTPSAATELQYFGCHLLRNSYAASPHPVWLACTLVRQIKCALDDSSTDSSERAKIRQTLDFVSSLTLSSRDRCDQVCANVDLEVVEFAMQEVEKEVKPQPYSLGAGCRMLKTWLRGEIPGTM